LKREIPILLTILCGLLITWSFFSPAPASRAVNDELLAWGTVFFSVAFLLGIGNLVRISLKQISTRHPDWPYKALLLVVLFGYLAVGMLEIHQVLDPIPNVDATGAAVLGPDGAPTFDANARRDWIYERIFMPLQATMFSLLAFYIASAAFRAFRARSLESTLLLTAGAMDMIGQVPIPPRLPGAEFIVDYSVRIQVFLMAYVNAAGQKAIIMGAALGTLATGLRIVLGIERSYLSE
jgi:hypothetical protein